MKINITAGDCLNEILKKRYPNEYFVPFCEAMIFGDYSSKLFSKEFIKERSKTHNVTVQEYIQKLSGFLDFLKRLDNYNEVVLWFGDEPFCVENIKIVLKTLEEYDFQGKVILNIVNETTGDSIETKIISFYRKNR